MRHFNGFEPVRKRERVPSATRLPVPACLDAASPCDIAQDGDRSVGIADASLRFNLCDSKAITMPTDARRRFRLYRRQDGPGIETFWR